MRYGAAADFPASSSLHSNLLGRHRYQQAHQRDQSQAPAPARYSGASLNALTASTQMGVSSSYCFLNAMCPWADSSMPYLSSSFRILSVFPASTIRSERRSTISGGMPAGPAKKT